MASKTEIANLALQHLGEYRIISIEDTGDKISRAMNVAFDQSRDEVLDSARWSEAKKQAQLSRLSAAPLFKWAAAYQLPPDWLRPTEIHGCTIWAPIPDFDRLGDTLVIGPGWESDELPNTLEVEYISRLEDTTRYSPLLVQCIALRLAIRTAKQVVGSDSKVDQLTREYEQVALPRAMTRDAQARYAGSNNPLRQMLRMSTQRRARFSAF